MYVRLFLVAAYRAPHSSQQSNDEPLRTVAHTLTCMYILCLVAAYRAPHSSKQDSDEPMFEPNHFSCPLVHTIRLPVAPGLEVRLRCDDKKTGRKLNPLQWLRQEVLRNFIVAQQRNLFVYKSSDTGYVYYMSVFKHRYSTSTYLNYA